MRIKAYNVCLPHMKKSKEILVIQTNSVKPEHEEKKHKNAKGTKAQHPKGS